MAGRRRYTKAFKMGAVRLVTEQGYSITEAARRLDIDRKTMHDWLGKFAPEFDTTDAAKNVGEDVESLQAELRRLREKNEQLQTEVAILKKATAYFAKDHK